MYGIRRCVVFGLLCLSLTLFAPPHDASGQRARLPYQDPQLAVETRVADLLSRLTLSEKLDQMCHDAPAVERLGIPQYNWWNEALHGVARAGVATVFPQAIGLGATFNPSLIHRLGGVIADEARAKHHEAARRGNRGGYFGLTFWSPNINIFRDPRWGRGHETYGEDPYLTSRLGVAFVRGLQGDHPKYLKTIATPKHFAVHSGPEATRHGFLARVSDRDLHDTYLPAFRATIVEGGAASVMCAYNSLAFASRTATGVGKADAAPCCANRPLLTDILRDEWGFRGYVVSDCGAVNDMVSFHKFAASRREAAALAIRAGADLTCGNEYRSLKAGLENSALSEADIDRALGRLLTARFRLGMFDPPSLVAYARTPFAVNDSAAHRRLALSAARESLVLLKNQANLLPLKKSVKTLAVIGPNAHDTEVLLGNYNGTPSAAVTLLDGIRRKVAPPARVLYAEGCTLTNPGVAVIAASALRIAEQANPRLDRRSDRRNDRRNNQQSNQQSNRQSARPRDGQADREAGRGLVGEYFTNANLAGSAAVTRTDEQVNFYWGKGGSPASGIGSDNFSARWRGRLIAPVTGEYELGFVADGGARLFLDDAANNDRRLTLDEWQPSDRVRRKTARARLEAGRAYDLRFEYRKEKASGRDIENVCRLVWAPPNLDQYLLDEAVAAASAADVVVLALGLSPRLEGERGDTANLEGFADGDRTTLDLPRLQESLLQAVHRVGKPVVLVLLNGSALSTNWASAHLPAILEAWYPGEEGGTAVADALFGDYNPGGRLPLTVYQSVNDLPDFSDYSMHGRTYRYFTGTPLYPFGYGLSYTKFRYRNLRLSPQPATAGQPLTVSVEVQNVGGRAGDEVAQLYVTDVEASVPVPLRSLQGVERIYLRAGERRRLQFTLTPRQLTVIDERGRRLFEPGEFVISVGGRQPDANFVGAADTTTTEVLSVRLRINGAATQIK